VEKESQISPQNGANETKQTVIVSLEGAAVKIFYDRRSDKKSHSRHPDVDNESNHIFGLLGAASNRHLLEASVAKFFHSAMIRCVLRGSPKDKESAMKVDKEEAARGSRWFMVAGSIAVAFAAALFMVDEGLSNSPRERVLGQTLEELRTAQASLPPARSLDERNH